MRVMFRMFACKTVCESRAGTVLVLARFELFASSVFAALCFDLLAVFGFGGITGIHLDEQAIQRCNLRNDLFVLRALKL